VKKIASMLTVLTVLIIIAISLSFNTKTAKAQTTDYTIESVRHTATVLYNGYTIINDTIQVSGATGELLIGFPYKYGSNIVRCVAYNTSDQFPVTLNVPLEDHIGFYGVKVDFPHGTPTAVNVIFVLSNELLKQDATNATRFTLDFPTYPTLTKKATICNASIILPSGATYISGSVSTFNYSTANMMAFNYAPGNVTFLLRDNKIQKFDIKEMNREIKINEFSEISVSETYRIENKAQTDLSFVEVNLLHNSSNPTAQDQLGRTLGKPQKTVEALNRYKITFEQTARSSELMVFKVKYGLPNNLYSTRQADTNDFTLNFVLFGNMNGYIEQASTSFVLPEGARMLSSENVLIGMEYSLVRNVFTESVTVSKENIIQLDWLSVKIVYEYNPLWMSFRPTLWIWALAVVGCAVAIVWKRPKVPTLVTVPKAAMKVSHESLKNFVVAYEEKLKINAEISSLEARAEKGKIPRRRYKVQKKTLEMRLETLSRDLTELKEGMRAAGGHYSELMLQLEVAEAESNEVGTNIKNTETLHNRGELSLEAYRKRLDEYQRRKEKAETTINGILLRLREEIR
jgi:hypothetical protein